MCGKLQSLRLEFKELLHDWEFALNTPCCKSLSDSVKNSLSSFFCYKSLTGNIDFNMSKSWIQKLLSKQYKWNIYNWDEKHFLKGWRNFIPLWIQCMNFTAHLIFVFCLRWFFFFFFCNCRKNLTMPNMLFLWPGKLVLVSMHCLKTLLK